MIKIAGSLLLFARSLTEGLIIEHGREGATLLVEQANVAVQTAKGMGERMGLSGQQRKSIAEDMLSGYADVKGIKLNPSKCALIIATAYNFYFDKPVVKPVPVKAAPQDTPPQGEPEEKDPSWNTNPEPEEITDEVGDDGKDESVEETEEDKKEESKPAKASRSRRNALQPA